MRTTIHNIPNTYFAHSPNYLTIILLCVYTRQTVRFKVQYYSLCNYFAAGLPMGCVLSTTHLRRWTLNANYSYWKYAINFWRDFRRYERRKQPIRHADRYTDSLMNVKRSGIICGILLKTLSCKWKVSHTHAQEKKEKMFSWFIDS